MIQYLILAFSVLSTATAGVCLGFIVKIRKDYVAQFKDTTAAVRSLGGQVTRMRQAPPKIRLPYEERLKAEYEKRGLKWETTTK
jgi:hypothetical protein